MAESVRVIVRCRPLNQREMTLNSNICVTIDQILGQCILSSRDGPPKLFTFDGVYYMDSLTEQIYNEIVSPLIENVVEGYNGTVFAYGQTGSGKTYSMQGDPNYTTQRGIIPRAFEHIFETISTISDTKFLVHVSYLEIYNEEVRDLLNNHKKKLEIKEHPEQGVYVASLSMHVCHSALDCENLMNEGFQNRHVGATLMNKDSSRSHSIFTVYVEALSENGSIRTGKLHLVDLAGSERQSKTGATGDRFKEATKINLSLSALGNVISALVDGNKTHVPYRDSKLTRLLQDSLGGNTKTVMIACISPSDNNYDETLSTLRYANRAKNIKNKPRINEDPKDALLREYKEEIERLKALIQHPNTTSLPQNISVDFEAEKQKLREEYERAIEDLRSSYESEQKSKERLQIDLERLQKDFDKANEQLEIAQKAEEKSVDLKEAKQRIELLQNQLVGGEQANNETLKQKRKKRLKEANKLQQLANAMNVKKEEEIFQAFSSTQEKLEVLTKKSHDDDQKIIALETEIRDLQREFETERLDYLETIRKQEQQSKLFQQIFHRVQPLIRKVNIEKMKNDAVWDEDSSVWILPDINGIIETQNVDYGSSSEMNGNSEVRSHIHGSDVESESRLKKRLDQSIDKDFFNTFIKRHSKPTNILQKYDVDRHKAFIEEKIKDFKRRNQKYNSLIQGVHYTDDVYNGDENDSHDNWQSNGTSNINSLSNSNVQNPINRPTTTRKHPQRLQAIVRN